MRHCLILVVLSGCLPAPSTDTDPADDAGGGDSGDAGGDGYILGGQLLHDTRTDLYVDRAKIVMLPFSGAEDGLAIGEIALETDEYILSDSVDFELDLWDTPPEEYFYQVDPDSAPSFEAAVFILGAYRDADQSGGPSAADEYVASGFWDYVVFADADLPDAYIQVGAEPGWNIVSFDPGNQDDHGEWRPFSSGEQVFKLETNLLPVHPSDGLRMTSVANGFTYLDQAAVVSNLVTCPQAQQPSQHMYAQDQVGTTEEKSLPGPYEAPPEDHFGTDSLLGCGQGSLSMPELDTDFAGYRAYAWKGVAGRESEYAEAAALASNLAVDQPVYLVYMRPTGFAAGLWSGYDGGMGWQIFHQDGGNPRFLAWSVGLPMGWELLDG